MRATVAQETSSSPLDSQSEPLGEARCATHCPAMQRAREPFGVPEQGDGCLICARAVGELIPVNDYFVLVSEFPWCLRRSLLNWSDIVQVATHD